MVRCRCEHDATVKASEVSIQFTHVTDDSILPQLCNSFTILLLFPTTSAHTLRRTDLLDVLSPQRMKRTWLPLGLRKRMYLPPCTQDQPRHR